MTKHMVHLKDSLDDLKRHEPKFVNNCLLRALLGLLITTVTKELGHCKAKSEDIRLIDLRDDEASADSDIEMTDIRQFDSEDELEILFEDFVGGINDASTEEGSGLCEALRKWATT